jgi:PTS system fructose-specific IIC component
MRLLDLVQGRLIIPQMRSRNKWDAIEELVDKLLEEHEIRIFEREEVLRAVLERERSRSTGLNDRVAMPHARTPTLQDPVAVLGIAPGGIPFESTDDQDAEVICLLLIPEAQYSDHIKTMADMNRLLSDARFRAELVDAARAGDAQGVLDVVERHEGPGFLRA